MSRRTRPEDLPEDPYAALAAVRGPFRRLRTDHRLDWFRQHPDAADVLLAAFLFVVAVTSVFAVDLTKYPGRRPGDPLAVVLIAALTWPVAVRRRWPRAALLVTILVTTPYLALNYVDNGATLGSLILMYTVASLCERRRAIAALFWSIGLILPVLFAGVVVDQEKLPIPLLIGNVAIYVTSWMMGNAVRNRRQLVQTLEERAADLELRRADEARRAVEEERARIARELHDVVAHGLSVMVVQAGGARRIVPTDPERAVEALRVIEATGRESMAEMRRLLGVLREEAGDAASSGPELAPQPGLAALPQLVERWTDAGLPVELHLEGDPRPLAAGEDVAAYRIVQEALTNVSKHAGPATATVTVRFADEVVELEVVDDGRGAAADDDGQGQGLVGMRERAALYGGHVEAGARPGGGYRVRATLPATAADPASTGPAAATTGDGVAR